MARSQFARPIKPAPDATPKEDGALLETLEDVLGRGFLDTYVDVGEALEAICNKRLYKAGYATFKEYLDKRWHLKRQTGYDYIHAAAVARNVRISVQTALPLAHAVALYSLPVEQQVLLARRFNSEHTPLPTWRQLVAQAQRARRIGSETGRDNGRLIRVVGGPTWQIELADAAEPLCPMSSLDLQVTSPPYGIGLRKEGYVDYSDYDDMRDRLLPRWAAGMFQAAAPWGRLAIVTAIDISHPQREPLAADWCQALKRAGWRYRTAIVWAEGNIVRSVARGTASPSAPNVICPAEFVQIFSKGDWNLAPVKLAKPGVWGSPDLTKDEWLAWTLGDWRFAGQHSAAVGGFPAAFSPELPRRLIKMFSFPGARVGDLFHGSGTTGEVAVGLGRQFYGSDIAQRWVDYARDRVRAASRAAAA